jgi:hypothetical protein
MMQTAIYDTKIMRMMENKAITPRESCRQKNSVTAVFYINKEWLEGISNLQAT